MTGKYQPVNFLTFRSNTFPVFLFYFFIFSICPPPRLLPVLGPLKRYMTPTLDSALLCSSRAGADLGWALDSRVLMFLHISMNVQPFSVHSHITQICESRDHINIEHAHSGYSLPKRDLISGPLVASYLNLDVTLDHSATMAGWTHFPLFWVNLNSFVFLMPATNLMLSWGKYKSLIKAILH